MRLNVLVLLILASVMVAGCSAPKAQTPEEAITHLKEALAEEDEGAFVACFKESKDYVTQIQQVYATIQQAREYEREIMDRAGAAALEPTGGMTILERLDEWLEGAKFQVDGDQAVCVLKDGETRFPMSTEEGSWVIEAKTFIVLVSDQVVAEHVADLGMPESAQPEG